MSTSLTPRKKPVISVITGVPVQGHVEKFLVLIPPHSPLPPQKLVESQVAVLLCCLCGLDNTDTNWSMRNKQCCSSCKHLTHREALQNTMRKVDIKQVFIFISCQRFCPAHCYLSDESLSFHSLSLLWFFMYNIYKMSYFYKTSREKFFNLMLQ